MMLEPTSEMNERPGVHLVVSRLLILVPPQELVKFEDIGVLFLPAYSQSHQSRGSIDDPVLQLGWRMKGKRLRDDRHVQSRRRGCHWGLHSDFQHLEALQQLFKAFHRTATTTNLRTYQTYYRIGYAETGGEEEVE